jgi:hypothetical protein
MRFVAVKSETAQANAVVFRARDLLVRQRTQAINALRGHLGEYGLVVAKGPGHVIKLVEHVEDPASNVPDAARLVLRTLVEALRFLRERIDLLDREIARRARENNEVEWDRSPPQLWLHWLRPRMHSGKGETSRPGWGSRLRSTLPAAGRSLARPQKWESERCGGS